MGYGFNMFIHVKVRIQEEPLGWKNVRFISEFAMKNVSSKGEEQILSL
jgi:hypothetical protein